MMQKYQGRVVISIMALLCPLWSVFTFKLIDTSHLKIAVELKITNQRQLTMHFEVTISNYLPPNSTFLKF